jgi:6-pyruvoyltetrahydropterin/6-carboxytetrahydropterin synthase
MDLNPRLTHPVLKKSIQELYNNRQWTDQVRPTPDELNTNTTIPTQTPRSYQRMRRCQTFIFDAAHYIPYYKGKCEQLHGHTYRLEVVIEEHTPGNPEITFENMKTIVKDTVIDALDHQLLNNLFENPTAEIITEWIATQLNDKLPLASLRLWEGHGKWAELILEKQS